MAGFRGLVLITGGSGGIGEALAHRAAADGHAVALAARSKAELDRAAAGIIAKHGVAAHVFAVDLATAQGCDSLAAQLEEHALVPDILINNAGHGLVGKAAMLPREAQLAMADLNVRSLTDLTLRYLPGMLARGRGGILNLASTAAFMPGPNMAVYFATKAYVLSFTDALAEECRGRGITVMSLCPGPVATGFQARAGMKEVNAMRMAGLVSAEEVAREGWEGFKAGKRMVIPGAANKLAAYATRGAPRRLLLPLLNRVMASVRKP